MTIALDKLIAELEEDPSLEQPDRVSHRLKALDHLDALLLHDEFPSASVPQAEAGIYRRARNLCAKLELANLELYSTIRKEIQRGAGPAALLHWASELGRDRSPAGHVIGEGYDALDDLIGGVLQLEKPEKGVAQMEAEMVFYQPTPARHIFDMIDRTALCEDDVLIDLGSGLGHVPLLTAICTGARAIGIELEAAYVDCAQRSAQAMQLSNVTFILQDARAADLSEGTVFYLYTPFVGAILRAVLDRLRAEAARRRIRVCTFGPCTATVAKEQWLACARGSAVDRMAFFSSRDLGTRH